MAEMTLKNNTIYGYYVMDWGPTAWVRIEESAPHNTLYEWCKTNCKGRFNWNFTYGHHRPENEPQVDAVTWGFEFQQDADAFKQMTAPGR